MSKEDDTFSICSIRRFPEHVRTELNRFLQRSLCQSPTREFSIEILQGVTTQGLDDIVDLVDSEYQEFQNDVRKRLLVLKNTSRGKTQCFKGKSKVGCRSNFYRFWLIGRHNADGLYDIVFCHICRKEKNDFFPRMKKIVNGVNYAIASTPQVITGVSTLVPCIVTPFLAEGNFLSEPPGIPQAAQSDSSFSDFTEDLGDRLIEYDLVEDLIARGTLVENADGTLALRNQH